MLQSCQEKSEFNACQCQSVLLCCEADPCQLPMCRLSALKLSAGLGISNPAEDELARFLQIFCSPCTSTGLVYMKDSWSGRRAELAERMKTRQLHLTAGRWEAEPDRETCFQAMLDSVNASSRINKHFDCTCHLL